MGCKAAGSFQLGSLIFTPALLHGNVAAQVVKRIEDAGADNTEGKPSCPVVIVDCGIVD